MQDPIATLPSLTVLTGPEAGRRIPLTTGRTAVLGRSPKADLTFPDEPSLSQLHARIERTGDQYTITDLGSTNGTHVNGEEAHGPVVLKPLDIITLGSLEFRFEPPGARSGTSQSTLAATQTDISRPRIRAVLADEHRPITPPPQTLDFRDMAEEAAAPAVEEERPPAPPAPAVPAADGVATDGQGPDANATALRPASEPGGATEPPGDTPFDDMAGARPAPQPPLPVTEPGAEEERAEPSHVVATAGGEGHPPPPLGQPLAETLAAVPLLHPLDPEQRAALARTMSERSFPAGTEIVRQGDEGLSLYVILEGTVQVQRAGPATGEIELATIEAGGFFGEMTVVDGLPRSATVRAVTDARCALLPRWGLEEAIRANPRVALEMLAVLSQRLRDTERLLTH